MDDDFASDTWIGFAAENGGAEVVAALLDAGFNIDAQRRSGNETALRAAIFRENDELVKLLLERGANPNLARVILTAVSDRRTPEKRMKYIRLLVEHGADVNQLFDYFGDKDKTFTVLNSTSDPDVIAYLREHGARTAEEFKEAVVEGTATEATTSSESVIQHFEQHYGPVDKRAEIEVISSGTPIAIYAVQPNKERMSLTLFTNGLSDRPMDTPAGQEEFVFAELFIQLSGDWKVDRGAPANQRWVTSWMRKIAQYPHQENTWLGGNFTVIDNEDPPQPFSKGVSFTSWLLLAEETILGPDDKSIHLYRMFPLWKKERDLVFGEGLGKLMQAFDKANVPFIVNMNRPSVV